MNATETARVFVRRMCVLIPEFPAVTMCRDGNNRAVGGSKWAGCEKWSSMPISSLRSATTDPQRARRRRTVLVAATVTLLSVAAAGCGDRTAAGSPAAATGTPAPSRSSPAKQPTRCRPRCRPP